MSKKSVRSRDREPSSQERDARAALAILQADLAEARELPDAAPLCDFLTAEISAAEVAIEQGAESADRAEDLRAQLAAAEAEAKRARAGFDAYAGLDRAEFFKRRDARDFSAHVESALRDQFVAAHGNASALFDRAALRCRNPQGKAGAQRSFESIANQMLRGYDVAFPRWDAAELRWHSLCAERERKRYAAEHKRIAGRTPEPSEFDRAIASYASRIRGEQERALSAAHAVSAALGAA